MVQWKMIDLKNFVAFYNDYTITIKMRWLPLWFIAKDGKIIDECYRHAPTKCELSCKVQAEKALKIILANEAGSSQGE